MFSNHFRQIMLSKFYYKLLLLKKRRGTEEKQRYFLFQTMYEWKHLCMKTTKIFMKEVYAEICFQDIWFHFSVLNLLLDRDSSENGIFFAAGNSTHGKRGCENLRPLCEWGGWRKERPTAVLRVVTHRGRSGKSRRKGNWRNSATPRWSRGSSMDSNHSARSSTCHMIRGWTWFSTHFWLDNVKSKWMYMKNTRG